MKLFCLFSVGVSISLVTAWIGDCWENCILGKNDTCPEGFECRSNGGCGLECYPRPVTPPIDPCVERCTEKYNNCPIGFECRSNGCYPQRSFCGPLMFEMYCQFGLYVIGGCVRCSCNPDPLIP
ncbi:uncharacterized protein LOC106060729 [Biomphalaria glabrata]|uniref:Uncharacterized protein LOC106060729 n=1 Tax=Biomphalaria glabrata TaxID=6526 RepID=A0A9W2ZJB7_BIOGL|nr:uncharacterized protein LOC106060729 [Biomphalaria glabrata]KAI8766549.1 hypothetical protein BgiMline_004219 [Biomphalaria glabrata]